MITVTNLTKIYKTPEKSGNILTDLFARRYRQTTALDEVSFNIEPQELVGFIGPNGAGKTTTMKILAGILYPTSGSVKVLGSVPFEKKHSFLRQISFVMGQKNQMMWELPAADTFYLNKEIFGIDDRTFKKRVGDLVDLLKCADFIDRPVKTLSLGQRMRVELIASLLHKPKILFLEEPTIGLDIFAQATIINFIHEYQRESGTTVMLTSHYMQDVQRLAKRVIMIDKGKIMYDGSLSELISRFSNHKTIHITLAEPLEKEPQFLKQYKHTYRYPRLSVRIEKKQIHKVLPLLLSKLDYADVTIEDEPIEEVIKKTFESTHTE